MLRLSQLLGGDNMYEKKPFKDILDDLYDLHEERTGEILKDKDIAKKLFIDKSALSKIKKGTRPLKGEEIEILAELFKVPMEVIVGKMDISEIPSVDKDGLNELSYLSMKWIFDNSKDKKGKKRVAMLNRILSNPKAANLLCDALNAYAIGIPIKVRSLDENYSNSSIEKILYKELILSSLDGFFDDIYRRTERDREQRTEDQVNTILKQMEKSKQALEQQHKDEDELTLQILEKERIDGMTEMNEDNSF